MEEVANPDRVEGVRRRGVVGHESRNQEATRERILRAALAEFGAKGYSGARTAGIAARAGVNQQLLSYHFGGKKGVLAELHRRWVQHREAVKSVDQSFADSLRAYFSMSLDEPDWARLVIWQALGDGRDDDPSQPDTTEKERLHDSIETIRRRQGAGELTDNVEPGFVLLLSYLLAFAPVAMPDFVEGLLELDPLSPEYQATCIDQLMRLIGPAAIPRPS